MSKIKKLYSMTPEALQKLNTLKTNNPDLSISEIVNALIITTSDDAKIKIEHCVEYDVVDEK